MSRELAGGWPLIPLSQISELSLGKMLDKNKNRGEMRPYLANINVRWGGFDLQDLREMRFEDREFERYCLRYGDIVMCEGGEPGRCAVWLEAEAGMMIQKALHRIRPVDGIDSHYLYYALAQKGSSGELAEYMTGGGIKHLPGEQLAKIEIPIPPIDEQRRIGEVLRAADAAIEAQRSYHSQFQAVAMRVRERLIWPDERYPMLKLGECISVMRNGAVYDAGTQVGDALVTRIETIADGVIDYSRTGRCELDAKLSSYRVKFGDILFSHINSVKHIGKTAIKRDDLDLYHGMNLMLLRANRSVVIPEYLYAVLLTERARAFFRGRARVAVNQASLNKNDIATFEMPCPSFEAQIEIVDRCEM